MDYTCIIQDVVISFVLASVLALVGILSAYLAVQWADLNNSDDQEVMDVLNGIEPDALPRARDVYAATAVSISIIILSVYVPLTTCFNPSPTHPPH